MSFWKKLFGGVKPSPATTSQSDATKEGDLKTVGALVKDNSDLAVSKQMKPTTSLETEVLTVAKPTCPRELAHPRQRKERRPPVYTLISLRLGFRRYTR